MIIEELIKKKEFKKFCKINRIKKPYIFLDRTRSDNLSQSIKTEATKNAKVLGTNLFKVYNYNRLHIVDIEELKEKSDIFKNLFKYKENGINLEEEIKKSNIKTISFSNKIASKNKNSIKTIENFIKIRQERAVLRYVYEIFKEEITKELIEYLVPPKNANNSEKYQFSQDQRYAFISTKKTLEVSRYNSYVELVNLYYQEGKSNKFKEKIDFFQENYANLNFKRVQSMPEIKEEIIEKIKYEKSPLKYIEHDAKKIKDMKKKLWINIFYSLEEKKYKIERFGYLMDRMDQIVHEESWSRKIWTRLNLSIRPYLIEFEKELKNQRLLINGYKVTDLEIHELNKNLKIIKNNGGLYENNKICSCNSKY